GAGPGGLGRRRDVAIGGRGGVKVDGAEGGHAHRREMHVRAWTPKERDDAPERLLRRGSSKAQLVHDLTRPGAQHADELGATPLNTAEHLVHVWPSLSSPRRLHGTSLLPQHRSGRAADANISPTTIVAVVFADG